MSFGDSVGFWFAAHLTQAIIGISFIALIFIAALVNVFIIDPWKKKRARDK